MKKYLYKMWRSVFKSTEPVVLKDVLVHLLIIFGIVLTLSLFYFYVYLPFATNHSETIIVPNVEGKNSAEVEEFLAEHDLRCEIDSSYSPNYPPLAVIKQYPAPGSKVKENRKIYISINQLIPPTVPMPKLVDNEQGGGLVNAEALLKANGLKRGKILFRPGPFLNTVVQARYKGKSIAPGTRIPKGSVIDLVVEDGKGSIDEGTDN